MYNSLLYIFRCFFIRCMYFNKFYILLKFLSFYHYIMSFFVLFCGLVLNSTMCDKYCYTSFFYVHLYKISFSIPSFLSLALKWIFCKQHIDRSFFNPVSYSVSFDNIFTPLTLKVIIHRYVLIAILLLVSWLFL